MKKRYVISWIISLLLWTACRTSKLSGSKPENKSHFQVRRFQRGNPAGRDSAIVVAHARKIGGETLSYFFIKIDGEKLYKSEGDSTLVFTLLPGSHNLIGASMGFYPIKINNYNIDPGDSLEINFYMQFEPIE